MYLLKGCMYPWQCKEQCGFFFKFLPISITFLNVLLYDDVMKAWLYSSHFLLSQQKLLKILWSHINPYWMSKFFFFTFLLVAKWCEQFLKAKLTLIVESYWKVCIAAHECMNDIFLKGKHQTRCSLRLWFETTENKYIVMRVDLEAW